MEKSKELKKYKKISVECILFSIAGMLILIFTNYSFDNGEIFMPEILLFSMLSAAGVILLTGIAGFVITSAKLKGEKLESES